MGRIVFRNGRGEKVEVNLLFDNGGRRNFALDIGEQEPQHCNDGETVMWGWFPFVGSGGGNPEPDCPAEDGDTVVIEDDCRIPG